MFKTDDYIKLCDVGDMLYRVSKNGIELIRITKIDQYPHYIYKDDNGKSYFNHTLVKSCFKTEEEAEEEIRKRKSIAEKRRLLKEYERKLNEKFNIKDHYIVK